MAYVNEFYIEQYLDEVQDCRAEGMEQLAIQIADIELRKGVDAKRAKHFLLNMLYMPNELTETIFFRTICTYGLRYNMSASDVLTLVSMKGAFDEIASGSAPGVFVLQ